MSDLKQVFNKDQERDILGKIVLVKVLRFGSIPTAADIVDKLLSELPNFKKDPKKTALRLIKNDFDSISTIMSETTNLSKADISDLDLASALLVLVSIMEVNGSFLEEYLTPAVAQAVERAQGIMEKQKSKTGFSQSKS